MCKTEKSIGLRQQTSNQFVNLQIYCKNSLEMLSMALSKMTSTTNKFTKNCLSCCAQRL